VCSTSGSVCTASLEMVDKWHSRSQATERVIHNGNGSGIRKGIS